MSAPTILRLYDNVSPLQWMREIAPSPSPKTKSTNPFSSIKKYPIHNCDDNGSPLTSPLARIHTAAHYTSPSHVRRQQHHRLKQTSPEKKKLKPIQFIQIQTMLGRRTKKGYTTQGSATRIRNTPLILQSLGNKNKIHRSDMLIALIPRTPLEKLFHRRATWIQHWWRRMVSTKGDEGAMKLYYR